MYIVDFHSCPSCRCPIELQMFAVSSLLGPSEINCLKCQQPVRLARMEWPEMSVKTRTWFFFVTLLYVIVVGMLTGNFIDQAFQLWNMDAKIVNLRFHSLTFQVFACVGGVAVILVQIYRIIASCRRSGTPYKLTIAEFILGLQWNLQFKFLWLLIIIWGVAKIKYAL